MNAQVAINRTGGLLVWQDNYTDGDGLGISALRLDANYTGLFGSFRVNQAGAGDQESPKVALFANGGAIIVWQSRTAEDPVRDYDVRARVMAPDGTFLTGDIVVNTVTEQAQRDPAVAVLANGDAVVVWSSYEQDGSRLGVFGQRLTAAGAKVGGEFQLNQETEYNQRNASIAALSDGRFAVVWVSEKPPVLGTSSVDGEVAVTSIQDRVHIYGRLFSAGGNPLTAEMVVDVTSEVCASPSIAASSQGGFAVTWAQKSNTIRTDSWDIFARAFDADGAAVGNPQKINSTTYGDQFAPRITSLGADFIAIWTSLGQDGSAEGVYGRFLTPTGGLNGPETRFNTVTVSKQIHPAAATDQLSRLLVVWSSFAATTGFDLRAQRFNALREIPTPAGPAAVARDSGSLLVIWTALSGFDLAGYEVYVDGALVATVTGTSHLVGGLSAGSSHLVQIAYRLNDGRRSELSAATLARTWGVDQNGDGLPDEWQSLYWGANVTKWGAANTDSDGDGVSNVQEFLAGTNPRDATSVLRMSVTGPTPNGQMYLTWNSKPGLVYQVQYSTNLVDWADLGALRFAAGEEDSVNIEPTNGVGYYRIVLVR
ncbi:MAG: hypothetical protein AB1705_15240 [Verrucomicrobiota bacterium]